MMNFTVDELAKKLCERLGHRDPNSINKMMGDGKADTRAGWAGNGCSQQKSGNRQKSGSRQNVLD